MLGFRNFMTSVMLADDEVFEENFTGDDDELGKEKDLDGESPCQRLLY